MLHNIYLGLHGLLVRQIKIKPQKTNFVAYEISPKSEIQNF
jgi:hypothetical protein